MSGPELRGRVDNKMKNMRRLTGFCCCSARCRHAHVASVFVETSTSPEDLILSVVEQGEYSSSPFCLVLGEQNKTRDDPSNNVVSGRQVHFGRRLSRALRSADFPQIPEFFWVVFS